MAIVRVGTDEVGATPNNNSINVVIVNVPMGGQTGDRLVVDVVNTSPGMLTSNPPTTPSGWERIGTVADAGTPSVHLTSFTKLWAATDLAVEIGFPSNCNAVTTCGLRRSSIGLSVGWMSGEAAYLAKDNTANTARATGSITAGGARLLRSVFGDRNGSTYSGLSDTQTAQTALASSASLAAQEATVAAGTYSRSCTASSSTSVAAAAIYALREGTDTVTGAAYHLARR